MSLRTGESLLRATLVAFFCRRLIVRYETHREPPVRKITFTILLTVLLASSEKKQNSCRQLRVKCGGGGEP